MQAMFEINKNSLRDPSKLTLWIGSWWFFWLSGLVVTLISAFNIEEDIDAMSCILFGASFILDILAALCFIKIISQITAAQMEVFDVSSQSE